MSRIARKQAVSIAEVLRDWLKSERLTVPLNTQRVFEAWDNASGAGRYTTKRFYRDGKLYITLSSSVIRSQLSFQKDAMLEKINSLLSDDPLFTDGELLAGKVKELILK